jgi:hypothetical protein
MAIWRLPLVQCQCISQRSHVQAFSDAVSTHRNSRSIAAATLALPDAQLVTHELASHQATVYTTLYLPLASMLSHHDSNTTRVHMLRPIAQLTDMDPFQGFHLVIAIPRIHPL